MASWQQVAQAGSTLVLADDRLAIAQHAAAQGWIAPGTLAEIEAEKEKDGAPTVIVEGTEEEE